MYQSWIPDVIGDGWEVFVPPSPAKRPWMSSNDRDHWMRRKTLSAYYRQAARDSAVAQRIPPLGCAWIVGWLAFGSRRRRDDHNYMPTVKACVDGVVDAGVLADDSYRYLVGPDLRRDEKRPVGITLLILPIEPREEESNVFDLFSVGTIRGNNNQHP